MKVKYPEIPWDEIAGMRDVLIHAYFRTYERLIYKTSTRDIPELKANVQSLLAEMSD
jgi:uncharacterized protein with HEPN domain